MNLTSLTSLGCQLAFSTDSYIVEPIFFPGGNIGHLSVCGTVNDIAMSGAKPLYLSASFIIEEGLPFEQLEAIVVSMAQTAKQAGVQIVTGDTKVAPRGKVDKLFINTCGIGVIPDSINWGAKQIQPDDVIIVSGTLGDHGAALLNIRENLGLDGHLVSDCDCLYPIVDALLPLNGVRALRDATRGGVTAVLHEFATVSECGFTLEESSLPINQEVQGVCELLGLDPINFANEGKLIAIVSKQDSQAALQAIKNTDIGRSAAIIGSVNSSGRIVVNNALGASRPLELPITEPMPRIC
ncbi:hydrogenase expression/formation protein HypE [Vibrio sonorensis]|uniref:hydrogenase expression/formation protein HypE n=1 Tax=Vibrio sonorensis TaxID=1004316 RepID=UPI000A57A509|nr:hydrogenase expression/formation protein HypE [Vibrio sonorensis]